MSGINWAFTYLFLYTITWLSESPTVTDVFCWALWLPLAVNVSVEAWSYGFWISIFLQQTCKLSKRGARVKGFVCSGKSPTHTQNNFINLSNKINFFSSKNWIFLITSITLMFNHILPAGLNDLLTHYKSTLYAFMCLWLKVYSNRLSIHCCYQHCFPVHTQHTFQYYSCHQLDLW